MRRQNIEKDKRRLQLLLVKQAKNAFHCNRIALFHPLKEEVPIIPLINTLRKLGKKIYFPVVSKDVLKFRRAPFFLGSYTQHALGVLEPKSGYCLHIHHLNIVGMPLVGFDVQLNRLGMGGGFYDRTFAKRNVHAVKRIGLALEVQKTHRLPSESWDIKPHTIITEKHKYGI